MKPTVIIFDLDGTLLPMEQDVFVEGYFKMLCDKLAPYGYDSKELIKGIWAGTAAMVKNDGSRTNEKAFWDSFRANFGPKALEHKPIFEEFYTVEFQNAKTFCGYNPLAKETVDTLKQQGYRVALATNPLFPAIATESRIRWAGLEPKDFELYTTYENSRFCKPNPDYYREVLNKLGADPVETLMVGNDVGEDMVAQTLGCRVFLLTDCLINKAQADLSRFPQGSFRELMTFLNNNC